MAKGKHKVLADRRKELQGEIVSLRDSKIRIQRLETTIQKLSQELKVSNQKHLETISRLNASLEAETSDKVQDLQQANSQLLNELGELRHTHKKVLDNWQKVIINLVNYLKGFGMTGMEATEQAMALVDNKPADEITIIEDDALGKMGADKARTIQKARGIRK
jgi:Mg2+ and Co2+ transporter CorA